MTRDLLLLGIAKDSETLEKMVVCQALYGEGDIWVRPENSLIWLAVAGSSIGALGAMFLLRHKTRHLKFILGIPAILLLQVLLVFWLFRR